jgi:hypothetical protein
MLIISLLHQWGYSMKVGRRKSLGNRASVKILPNKKL